MLRGSGKPKPFQRKSISISTDIRDAKKEWRDCHPSEIEVGDIILGKGLVVGGKLDERHEPIEGRLTPFLYYSFEMKNGTTVVAKAGIGDYYQPKTESVRAFVRVRG